MTFSYKARNKTGEVFTGRIDASNASDAIAKLEKIDLSPIKVQCEDLDPSMIKPRAKPQLNLRLPLLLVVLLGIAGWQVYQRKGFIPADSVAQDTALETTASNGIAVVNSTVRQSLAQGTAQAQTTGVISVHITNGMPKVEVIAILGRPCGEVAKDNHVTLYFKSGDVIELDDGQVQATDFITVRQGVDPLYCAAGAPSRKSGDNADTAYPTSSYHASRHLAQATTADQAAGARITASAQINNNFSPSIQVAEDHAADDSRQLTMCPQCAGAGKIMVSFDRLGNKPNTILHISENRPCPYCSSSGKVSQRRADTYYQTGGNGYYRDRVYERNRDIR